MEEDNVFLYKKVENFVILKLPIMIKSGHNYNPEKEEMCFGFIMKTNSLRSKKEPFEMSVPMFINIGKYRRPSAPSQ
jgi:hypothetical protein